MPKYFILEADRNRAPKEINNREFWKLKGGSDGIFVGVLNGYEFTNFNMSWVWVWAELRLYSICDQLMFFK